MALDEKPDLILLDLVLPGMHGFEVLRGIRANISTEHIPVVILSVLSEGEKVRQAMQLGANDYAVKGKIKPMAVLEKVQLLLAEAKLKEKWIEASTSSNNNASADSVPAAYMESNRIITCPVCLGEMVMKTNSGSGPVVVCPRCESQY
ncbi:MAG: response regulator [Deltaproteobacteria bacterium]|nr:response regulator [Deltaproteobacteria bacterium]